MAARPAYRREPMKPTCIETYNPLLESNRKGYIYVKRTALCIFSTVAVLLAADLDRGRELYVEGKYAEAEAEFRAVLEDDAGNAAAQRYLGLALIEQDKVSDAAPFIKKAHELDASPENKLALARLLVEQKEYAKADEAIQDAAGEDLEYVRGLVHLNRRRYEEAARDLESFIEKNPDRRPYAHYYAGMAYNGLKRPDKMLTHFQHFIRMKPNAPEARKVRAILRTGH